MGSRSTSLPGSASGEAALLEVATRNLQASGRRAPRPSGALVVQRRAGPDRGAGRVLGRERDRVPDICPAAEAIVSVMAHPRACLDAGNSATYSGTRRNDVPRAAWRRSSGPPAGSLVPAVGPRPLRSTAASASPVWIAGRWRSGCASHTEQAWAGARRSAIQGRSRTSSPSCANRWRWLALAKAPAAVHRSRLSWAIRWSGRRLRWRRSHSVDLDVRDDDPASHRESPAAAVT